MKKLISCIILAAMLVTLISVLPVSATAAGKGDVWDGTVGTAFDGGTGEEDNPYLISSAETLAYLASVVNSGKGAGETSFLDTYFKLTCDIDLDNKPWIPIGFRFEGSVNGSTFFGGHLDGCGYAVYNLNSSTYLGTSDNSIVAAQATAGLFGALIGGSIKNLGIESGTVSCKSGYAGGIVGGVANGEIIENCYNKATIVKADDTTWTVIGGIAGAISGGKIVNTVNYGTVDCSVASAWMSGNNMFGGISGRIYGVAELENCYNVGAVATGKCRGGGIGGRVHGTPIIKNCTAAGVVTGTNQFGVVFGIVEGGTFEGITCYMKDQTVADILPVKADASGLATDKITVNSTDAFELPCAVGEAFLMQTPNGLLKLSTVAEGTPTVDGILDEVYVTSARLLSYGTANNALSEDAWTGAKADIYLLADYQNLYIAVKVKDADVVKNATANDSIEVTLSFDGGATSFVLTLDAAGDLTAADGNLDITSITKAVSSNIDGWCGEIAVPVEFSVYNLLSQSEVGVGIKLNDAATDGSAKSYSMLEAGKCTMYPLGEIHGKAGVAVAGVSVSQSTAELYIGQGLALKAVLDPVDAYERGVVWSSSDTAVAAVSAAGYVTAGQIGEAIITVKTVDGEFTATCAVKISAVKATGITISQDTLELKLGKKKMLTCTFTPENTENQALTWSSSNEAIATVSEAGLVTACGGGSAVITATSVDGGFTATCTVTVTVELDSISVEQKTLELSVGESSSLTTVLDPLDATEPLPTLIWSSSNPDVATVDQNGKVTAVGAGTTVITFTTSDGTFKDETGCTVTVTAEIATEAETTGETPSDTDKKGCSSVVCSAFVMLLTIGAASTLVLRKKREL